MLYYKCYGEYYRAKGHRYRRAGLIDQLSAVYGYMAASDAGEEAAWTKINGSSVHAHTDTYLCIVARNHS